MIDDYIQIVFHDGTVREGHLADEPCPQCNNSIAYTVNSIIPKLPDVTLCIPYWEKLVKYIYLKWGEWWKLREKEVLGEGI